MAEILVYLTPEQAKVLAELLREVELARAFAHLTGIPVERLLDE